MAARHAVASARVSVHGAVGIAAGLRQRRAAGSHSSVSGNFPRGCWAVCALRGVIAVAQLPSVESNSRVVLAEGERVDGVRQRSGGGGDNGGRSSDRCTGSSTNNYAINGWLIGAPSVPALLEVVEVSRSELNPVNVCTALTQLSRLLNRHPPLCGSPAAAAVQQLAAHMTANVDVYMVRSLCQGVSALATLGHKDAAVYVAAQTALVPQLDGIEGYQLARLASSLFHSGHASAELFAEMETRVANDIDAFDVCSLSYITLSYAELGFTPASTLFDAASARFQACIADFHAPSLTRALRSFVVSGRRDPELMDAIAATLSSRQHRLRPEALIAVARLYAQAGHAAPELLAFVESEVAKELQDVKLSAVATVMWSFAKSRHRPARHTSDSVAALVVARPLDLSPADAARLLWAFARLELSPKPAVEVLQASILRQLSACTDVELVNALWASARLRVHEPRLFEEVGRALVTRIPSLTPQGIAVALWAHATMGYCAPEELCRSVEDTVSARLSEFDSQNLANLVWACAAMDTLTPDFLRMCARRLEEIPKSLRPADLRSFYQADLALRSRHRSSTTPQHVSYLQPKLATVSRAAWDEVQQTRGRANRVAMLPSIEATLSRLDLSYAANCLADDSEVRVDFIVRGGEGCTVAVEALTPKNFATNAPRHKLGRTRLKERLLCGRTDAVVDVPYYEWSALKGSAKAEEEYLWGKLEQHVGKGSRTGTTSGENGI